jgi:hypothetical protein
MSQSIHDCLTILSQISEIEQEIKEYEQILTSVDPNIDLEAITEVVFKKFKAKAKRAS